MGQTVLILGGGIGGVAASNALRRALPKEHRVVLVEREPAFVFMPSLPWILTGARSRESISRPLDRPSRKGIEVVRGEIERIDPARKEAVVSGRPIAAGHMVIALGAKLVPEAVPYVPVDRNTLQTSFERVYAVGDVTGIPLKMGKPLPKAGVFAHAQAEVVARNIAKSVTGSGAAAAYDGEGSCFIEAGDGQAGFGAGNFYAEPAPAVKLHAPGRHWHIAKVLLEKRSLGRGSDARRS